MTDSPTDEHLEEQARKIISASGGIPDDVNREMTQAALETSSVHLEALDQEAYDLLFEETNGRLRETLNEMECTDEANLHEADAIDWDEDPVDVGPTWVELRGICTDCGTDVHGYFDLMEVEDR